MTVSDLEKFMAFDQEQMKINFEGMTNETSGNYTIEIELEDSLGKTATFEVEFEILPIEPEQLTET